MSLNRFSIRRLSGLYLAALPLVVVSTQSALAGTYSTSPTLVVANTYLGQTGSNNTFYPAYYVSLNALLPNGTLALSARGTSSSNTGSPSEASVYTISPQSNADILPSGSVALNGTVSPSTSFGNSSYLASSADGSYVAGNYTEANSATTGGTQAYTYKANGGVIIALPAPSDANAAQYYSHATAAGFSSKVISALGVNNSGTALGTAARYITDQALYNGSNAIAAGTDNFIYIPGANGTLGTSTVVGLFDTSATKTYSYATANSAVDNRGNLLTPVFSQSGHAAGSQTRYLADNSGTNYGADAWYTVGTTSYQIGIVDPTSKYSFVSGTRVNRQNSVVAINATGAVAGNVTTYTIGTGSLTTEAWVYNPSSLPTTTTSAYGNGYTRVGLYDQSTGAGTYGHVITGYTGGTPANNLLINNNISTNRALFVGPTVGGVTTAAGTAGRYAYGSNFSGIGADAWYFNGSTSTAINPTGNAPVQSGLLANSSRFNNGSGATTSSVTAFGQSALTITTPITHDLVGGYTYRYTGTTQTGQEAWIYDAVSQLTTVVDPITPNSGGYAYSYIGVISNGTAIGYAKTYTSGSTIDRTHYELFAYTVADGVSTNLGYVNLTGDSSISSGTDDTFLTNYVRTFTVDSVGTIYGTDYNTSTAISTNANASRIVSFALSPALIPPTNTSIVPEPASLALLGMGGLLLARRRRSVR